MDIERHISKLNPRQRQAVLHADGPLLILAGAGSGKTRVITTRAAYLLHRGVPPSSVLAVTFTNKAAREMRSRVRTMCRAKENGLPAISTFHSLCLSILRQEIHQLGYRKNFTVYDTSEQMSLLRNILSDITFHDKTFKIESVLERISRSKNASTPADGSTGGDDKIGEITEALSPKYNEALRTLNALDFDDLLLLTLRLFREHADVLARYREKFLYLMVDEYQDTNKVQYEFIKLLAGERKNLCVVGDDDQSIYGWRGAHIGNVLDFGKDFPAAAIIRLEQNYRSTGHILEAANQVIRNNKARMEKSLWTAGTKGQKIGVYRGCDGEDEARWVANRISMTRFEKNTPFEHFAVIYRANLFSKAFEEALRKLRIPYSVIGGTSYFEYKEIRDLTAYLKIISNPRDDLSFLRAANTPKRGLGTNALGKLAEFATAHTLTLLEACCRAGEIVDLGARAASSAIDLYDLIERYRIEFERTKDLTATFRSLVKEIRYEDYLRELYKRPESASRKVENLESFFSSLTLYTAESEAPSLRGFLENLALTDILENKDEDDRHRGVTLISFHSAKGLEFPIVFISGVEEDILPHKKSAEQMDTVEEERRLFYVGITRAMKELYITYAARRTRYGKDVPAAPSRFLEEIPEEVITRVDGSDSDPLEEEEFARKSLAHIRALLAQ